MMFEQQKLERVSGAFCNDCHLEAVVYAHMDVRALVARDVDDVAHGDEARVRLLRHGLVFPTRVNEETSLHGQKVVNP